jgi:23S rRNA pseudouridine2605 synthase
MNQPSVRLNKYLALHLGISRREADEMIKRGRIRIGEHNAQIGDRVTTSDEIYLDNRHITRHIDCVYILFHKPIGYVCSRRKQGDTPTIYSLLPKKYHHLKPVGRLDKDSSGLLLLTNDGDFAHRMTHPSFRKIKIYEVTLDKPLEPLHQQMINEHGIQLNDGISQFQIEKIAEKTYRITMKEGRNRQIRRTFAALGYTVIKLHRIQFGTYQLDIASRSYKTIMMPS